jgi:polyferredoxin
VTENRESFVHRYLVVAYLIEVGLILLIVPWSAFWERNYFTQAVPLVAAVFRSPTLRGAVSGFGVVSLAAGIADLVSLLVPRRE